MQNEITVKPVISIIILNWNNWKDTLECLNSIFQMNYPLTNIILVDNNSTDGSIKQIKDFTRHIPLETVELSEDEINKSNSEKTGIFKKEIHQKFKNDIHQKFILIKNNENRGFAGGNNVGINFALEYLDPD
ncbi:MAG: glycosyltransferase, partial [Methanobacterium sp.]|nr:glycosyltransferase [Methanobacterium sp.]